MADHVDESGETVENKSLDQSAIDDAIAAMQMDDSETGQAAPDGPSGSDGSGESVSAAEAPEQAVHANGGETFGEAQSDGQEDLDAAIAAIQEDLTEDSDSEVAAKAGEAGSDKVDQEDIDATIAAMQAEASEEVETAAADETGSETVGQEDIDATIAAMQAEASENNDSAAAHEAGTDDVGQEDFDAAIAAMQSDVTEDEEKEEDISSVPEKSPPESADLEAADPEVNASGPGSLQDDAEDDSAGADVDRATDEAIDTKNASESDDDPQEALDSSFVEKGEGASPEHNEAGSKATFADDNTFSDLDESDLEAAKPDRATEADELAALTTSFDDEKDFRGLDDEDAEPATARAGDKPTAEGSTQTDHTEVLTDDKTGSQGATAKKNTESRATDEAGRKSGGRKKYAGILVIAATILIGLGVIYGPDFYSAVTAGSKEIGPQTMVTEAEPSTAKPVTPPVVTTPEDPYLEKLQDVSRLRADLLAKKDEIDQLKEFYRDGISELEEELQQEATRQKVEKLAEALANRKIELDLRSIQRRWAYIDELEKPSHWLFQGSEELLFLSRRARIDLKMSEIASGIELTRHTRRLNASLQKYQLSPERLAIDLDSSRLRPLEDIWQAIGAENKIIAQRAVASGDRAIIEDICGGDTGRIAELSTLTIRASKCLAQIESSEFFLNRLTSMSPVAAKYLSNWNGQWLCLNGFRELPPEVARHLFSWDGDWISLNGLKDFPPQIGEMLLSWQGRQLELMGLVYHPDQIERIGLQQLSDWEKSGGKLFVPERIRTEISNLK